MKITVDKKDLVNGLKTTNIIKTNSLQPILQGILFRAKNNKLTLVKTNLDITSVVEINAKVEKEGKIVINENLLVKIIANLPGEVKIELNKNNVKINKYKIHTLDVDDFPNVFQEKKILQTIKLDKNYSEFAKFVSGDGTKYVLENIYFGDNFVCSSDGRRVLLKETKTKLDFFIKPELTKHLIEKIDICENDIIITTADGVFYQRKIVGEFPDVKKYIPDYKDYVEVDNKELMRLVKATMPLVSENDLVIKLEITKDKLTVSKDSDTGNFTDSMDCKATRKLTIGFNPNYLLDFLSVFDEDITRIDIPIDGKHLISCKEGSKIVLLLPVKL